METGLWIAGIIFLIILIIWWKLFLILFAVTGVVVLLVIAFFTWRVSMLKSAPGIFEIKEIKGDYFCTVHTSAHDRVGLQAIHAPMFGYLLAAVILSGVILSSHFDL